MQGIVVVYKPQGWSSFDVVKKMKRIFNTSKVGHLGTLDPMAEGVLPVAIGKATKLFDFYLSKSKSYIAELEFGYETDTLDAEGEITSRTDNIPTEEQVKEVLEHFIGKNMQTPPKYSAVKINGKRAYALARENKDFEISAKEVEISALDFVVKVSDSKYVVRIECSAGTYIRSLVRDIAYKLNSLATMTSLERIRSGNFAKENSFTIEEIEKLGESCVTPISKALEFLPKIELNKLLLDKLKNGVEIKIDTLDTPLSTIYVGNILFGLGRIINKKLKITTRVYEGEKDD